VDRISSILVIWAAQKQIKKPEQPQTHGMGLIVREGLAEFPLIDGFEFLNGLPTELVGNVRVAAVFDAESPWR